MVRLLRSRFLIACVASVFTALVVGGIGWAIQTQSPVDGAGVVHACYNASSGAVHLDVKGCSSGESALTWNQQGAAGDSIVTRVVFSQPTLYDETVVATCVSGDIVVGGGWRYTSTAQVAVPGINIVSSQPQPGTNNQWAVTNVSSADALSPSQYAAINFQFSVYALCLKESAL